jgi:hypothetical protein
MAKSATTIRIPDDKLRIIRAIAGYENRSLADIFTDMAEEYIARHRETMELLRIPGFVEECRSGLAEIASGGGKQLSDLDD